jgi:hypothetical protein
MGKQNPLTAARPSTALARLIIVSALDGTRLLRQNSQSDETSCFFWIAGRSLAMRLLCSRSRTGASSLCPKDATRQIGVQQSSPNRRLRRSMQMWRIERAPRFDARCRRCASFCQVSRPFATAALVNSRTGADSEEHDPASTNSLAHMCSLRNTRRTVSVPSMEHLRHTVPAGLVAQVLTGLDVTKLCRAVQN